jgi:hypothetical protein
MTKRQKIDMSREIRQWLGLIIPAAMFVYKVYTDRKGNGHVE